MKRIIAGLVFALCTTSVSASPILSGYSAKLQTEVLSTTGTTLIHLLSGAHMSGALARGLFDADDTDTIPAVNTIWMVQSRSGRIAPDGERIVSFAFDDTGSFLGIQPTPFFDPNVVAGIEPTPFRVFLAEYPPDPISPPTLIGELDFTSVTSASIGSINSINGLTLTNLSNGGAALTFEPFNIVQVSLPAPLALMLVVLPGAMLTARRQRDASGTQRRG